MQLLILVLFIALFMHEAIVQQSGNASIGLFPFIPTAWLAAAVLLPKLLIGLFHHIACRRTIAAIVRGDGQPALRRLERTAGFCRNLVVASYLVDLFVLGALVTFRRRFFNVVLLDELIIMLPALLANVWMWLSYYPVDVHVRHATFMSRVQQGLPVHIWSRGQYLLSQLRHQWALMGLPMLLLMGWWEAAPALFRNKVSQDTIAAMMFAGGLVVFLFTPVMIRHVWDTAPLPAGDLRDRLIAMCRQYRVGIRELLLWRTFGGMINGAVMGILAPLRYILLTDGLLETMPQKQVEAVMAHEVAHIRKHHVFWLLAIATASMSLLQRFFDTTVGWTFDTIAQSSLAWRLPDGVHAFVSHPQSAMYAAAILSLAGWFHIFGWVSRRFERQADTFAVQHMARQWHEDEARRSSQSTTATASAAVAAPSPGIAEAIITAPPAISAATASDTSIAIGSRSTATALPPIAEPAQMILALENGQFIAPPPATPPLSPTVIPPAAADVMARALQNVAELNCIPVKRNSWRHGSIAWRQNYLRTLPGTPIDAAAIDRQVRHIKWAGAVLIAGVVAMHVLAP